MPNTGYAKEDIARRGEEIYERQLRDKVETEHRGKFLVVDVDTGAYEIDAQDIVAIKRARAKNPEATLYMVRVGYETAYSLGGRMSIRQP